MKIACGDDDPASSVMLDTGSLRTVVSPANFNAALRISAIPCRQETR
ncbi:hypothetical protein SEA_REMREM_11 [Gordonia phage RemRem]